MLAQGLLEGWGVMQALEPVLYEWTAVQLGLLGSWVARLLSAEAWRPVTQPHGCARQFSCRPQCILLAQQLPAGMCATVHSLPHAPLQHASSVSRCRRRDGPSACTANAVR